MTRIRIAGFLAVAACVTACGGGTTNPPAAQTSPSFAAATSTACFTASTSAQVVDVPSAAGLSATVDIAAAATAGASCADTITLATGSDALSPSAIARRTAQTQTVSSSAGTAPLFSMSLSAAFSDTNNVVMTNAALSAPANLHFTAGTYYALVTYGTRAPEVLQFQASNGVLYLQSTGGPIVVFPGSTAVISVYPKGVIPTTPPTASPSPGASASPTPAGSPSPVPTMVASGANCDGAPGPGYTSCGLATIVGSYDGGMLSGQAADPSPVPILNKYGPPNYVYIPGAYFTGTITVTLTNYDPGVPLVIQPGQDSPCPSSMFTQSGPDGNILTLQLPANGQQYNLPQAYGGVGCYVFLGPQASVNQYFSLGIFFVYGTAN